MDTARNQMIDIERLSDLELDAMQTTYEKLKPVGARARRGALAAQRNSEIKT
jgi:hypothetical protein